MRNIREPVRCLSVAGIGLVLLLASCSTPTPAAPSPPAPDNVTPGLIGPRASLAVTGTADPATFTIGPAAADTVGGWLPGEDMLSPFDGSTPVLKWLDPPLLKAVQDAARSAAAEGVDMKVTSGWRSRGFQQRLLDNAIRSYGTFERARDFVALPGTSMHVRGKAVDIGPPDAAAWMIRNGPRFGLCQVYANEAWHFELAVDERGNCPPLKPNANA